MSQNITPDNKEKETQKIDSEKLDLILEEIKTLKELIGNLNIPVKNEGLTEMVNYTFGKKKEKKKDMV